MSESWLRYVSFSLTVAVLLGFARVQGAKGESVKQLSCSGKVVDELDQPIGGVTVSLYVVEYDGATYTYKPELHGEVQTATDGTFSLTETVKDSLYNYGHIVAEKEGRALGFDNWNMRDGNKELQMKLGPSKRLEGIVVDEAGAPLSGAQVIVSMLALGEGEGRPSLTGLVALKQLTTNTDATGRFAFTRIPAGATAEFIVTKPGKATISTYERTQGSYAKLHFTEGQEDIRLVMPVEAKIEGVTVEKSSGKPVGGVTVRYTNGQEVGYFRPKPLVSKEDGTFTISALEADRYLLELAQPIDELPEWVAERAEVVTEAGKTRNDVKIELSKGGVLEIVVTDAVKKEPVDQAGVGVSNQTTGRSMYNRAGEDGIVRMRLTPGNYQIYQVYKQGYSSQRSQGTVTIEDGKTEHLEYELVSVPKIAGIVRDEKGQTVEGVRISVCPMGTGDNVTTDAEGKFEVSYDPATWGGPRVPVSYLVFRHEKRNLATATQIDESTGTVDVKLAPAMTFTGKVVDPNGNGISGATFYVNMRASNWGSPIGRNFPKTDEQGNFEINAIPAEHKYGLYARAEGYGETRTDVKVEEAVANRVDMGMITLPIANLAISGVVVDSNDTPVAGVRITCYGDNQPHRTGQTDKDGKFTIEKVCVGRIRISASKAGATRLSGSIQTEGGATDVKVVIGVRSSSGRYVPKRPPSLVGRPLPDTKGLNLNPPLGQIDGKRLLICFWDMEQRPSRHCLTQLTKQAKSLKSKGVVVIVVHASTIDRNALDEYVKKYKVPFSVGMVQADAEKARFAWGVQRLPWLIFTDTNHVVVSQSQGFRIADLDNRGGQDSR